MRIQISTDRTVPGGEEPAAPLPRSGDHSTRREAHFGEQSGMDRRRVLAARPTGLRAEDRHKGGDSGRHQGGRAGS